MMSKRKFHHLPHLVETALSLHFRQAYHFIYNNSPAKSVGRIMLDSSKMDMAYIERAKYE